MLQFMLDTSLSDAEKFPLKMLLTLLSLVLIPTTAPDSIVWCSDPQNVIKDLPTVGLTWRLFLLSNAVQGDWDLLTQKQSALLIRRVVARMKQQQLYLPTKWFPVLARNACLQRRVL